MAESPLPGPAGSETKKPVVLSALLAAAVIGLLATTGVPLYTRALEKFRFSEAMPALLSVEAAQTRMRDRTGGYAASLDALDVAIGSMTYFSVGRLTVTGGGRPAWRLLLHRRPSKSGACPPAYGCYTVTYAFPPGTLSCSHPDCAELMPRRP